VWGVRDVCVHALYLCACVTVYLHVWCVRGVCMLCAWCVSVLCAWGVHVCVHGGVLCACSMCVCVCVLHVCVRVCVVCFFSFDFEKKIMILINTHLKDSK
jgi:hypothetical protein